MTSSPSVQHHGSGSGLIAPRLHTHTPPGSRCQRWSFAPQGSCPGAQRAAQKRFKRKEREGGGKAGFSLPASPSALQTRGLCDLLSRRENIPVLTRGWTCSGAGTAPWHSARCPLSPPAVPSGVSPRAMGCQGTSCSGDGHVASHRLLLSSLLAHLGGGARMHAHTHTYTHQTNPESGLLSERINYWLMNIQIRNSAEPGGGLALGAALGRRIPPERYKSPLPLRRFPSGERSLLGKAEPRFPFFFFFFPLPLLHFQSARGPRNYNGLL